MTTPTHRIEIFASDEGENGKRWYFRIRRVNNGKIVAQSEGYHNRADCRRTATELRNGLATADIFGAND